MSRIERVARIVRSPVTITSWTIGLWCAGVVYYGHATVSSKLALPPSLDLYTNTAGFQWLSFAVAKLVPLAVFLLVLLAAEIGVLSILRAPISSAFRRVVLWTAGALLLSIVLYGAYGVFVRDPRAPVNPYYWPFEQSALAFVSIDLPLLTSLSGLVLWLQIRFAKRRAVSSRLR